MRPNVSTTVIFVLLLAVWAAAAQDHPNGFKSLAIGDPAPDFKLPGVDDQEYTLQSFTDAHLLLVVFTCNHCPTAQAYESRIMQLHADFRDKGVALVAISPNDPQAIRLDELAYTDVSDSFEDMKVRAKDRGFEFPYLYDGDTQEVSLAYGVLATPQVFLFDQDRRLSYVGRIDDSAVNTVTSHDVRNALDALLAGRPVPIERTRVFGSSTKWIAKREEANKSLVKSAQEPVSLELIDEAALARLVKNDSEKLLLVNLWATWCGPCVRELPEFATMNRMYGRRNFQLVTISLDERQQKEDALQLLRKKHVTGANYISTIADRDRFAELLDKQWPGRLPYTLLITPGGKIVYRKSGEIEPLEVRRAIVDVLGRTYADDAPKPGPAKEPELRLDLLRRVKADQEARATLVAWLKEHGSNGVVDPAALTVGRKAEYEQLGTVVKRADQENTEHLDDVIEQHGWPTVSLVGRDGSHAAWLLVQHADANPKFQRKCFDLMTKLPQAEVSLADVAYLTDRVLLAEGKKQIYGTQFTSSDGKWEPRPLEDPVNVDKRRAEAGLKPLAEYVKDLDSVYNSANKQ